MSLFPFACLSVCLSVCLSICLSVCLSVCHAPYLRNHTSCNHNLWYTFAKMMISRDDLFMFFILVFWALKVGGRGGRWGGGGCKKAKNSPKWKIQITSHPVLYLRNSLTYDHNFWYTLIFRVVRRISWKKGPKWQKTLLCRIF